PDVRLNVTLPPDLPPIWVHPALVEQALFNVLENAAKFSPLGEAIDIVARIAADQLQLDIRDHGPGIPPEERSRIFDMFYTGDSGNQGTGLGLNIAQGMVGAHGGSIEALPVPEGNGTLIRISLPLTEPPSPPDNANNADAD
ncbi:MAG: sensor for high-affinity potassium transporter, partial [Zoogloeaceae bacterium]|nr:sensor for high-affinity potassium transporter [Zoogloeaceae bacterium]